MAQKIGLKQLRSLINEELEHISESVDHASIRDIVNVASKLLAAVEDFEEKAPHAAVNAVTPQLSQIAHALEDMLSSPGSYVTKPKAEPRVVSLRAVKDA